MLIRRLDLNLDLDLDLSSHMHAYVILYIYIHTACTFRLCDRMHFRTVHIYIYTVLHVYMYMYTTIASRETNPRYINPIDPKP